MKIHYVLFIASLLTLSDGQAMQPPQTLTIKDIEDLRSGYTPLRSLFVEKASFDFTLIGHPIVQTIDALLAKNNLTKADIIKLKNAIMVLKGMIQQKAVSEGRLKQHITVDLAPGIIESMTIQEAFTNVVDSYIRKLERRINQLAT